MASAPLVLPEISVTPEGDKFKDTNLQPGGQGLFDDIKPAGAGKGLFDDIKPATAAPSGGGMFDDISAAPAAAPTQLNIPPWLSKMVEPFTGYGDVYRDLQRESRTQMATGIEQFGAPDAGVGGKALGALNVGLGAVGYGFSPIQAGLRSIAGKPIEENIGIPKEYTEFALGLGLPGIGFAKAPKGLQALVSPETISPQAMEAAALIRSGTGPAARSTETTAAQLEPYERVVNALPPAEQLNIQKYIGGAPSGTAPVAPELRALTDTLRAGFKERRTALENLPQTQSMHYYDEYFPQMWADPQAAKQFVGSGAGAQGGSGSTRGRKFLTLDDGINAGLVPFSTNPIEVAMRYFTSVDKFVNATKIFNEADSSGIIRWTRPKTTGASGQPSNYNIPPGYVELQGRWAQRMDGSHAYAPEDWARVYNNWLSRGWAEVGGAGEYGKTYDMLRKGSNAATQALLSFSGYHAFTMAEASMATQLARAMEAVRAGKPADAAKAFLQVPLAPVRYGTGGGKWKDIYLGKSLNISPQDREIVDLITQAGGRMSGHKHALDYQMSSMGSYLNSFRRGRLASEFKEYGDWIKGRPVVGSAQVVASTLGRTMEQWNQPLFQHYIPAVKNSAAAGNMAQWLKYNPNASQADKLAAARSIVNDVDNRFGEMIHDNIFWNKLAKQTAMLAMISYSWNVGGIRAIGGGLRDMARFGVGQGTWTPQANYVVATAITWAELNAMYQYIKTGEAPKDIHDLVAARTGGVDARSGEPERIIPPGIMKDVFAYYEHFGQEVVNKVGPGPKVVGQTASIMGGMGGSDWRGDPILSPRKEGQSFWDKIPEWLVQYFQFLGKTLSPIQASNLYKGKQTGSNLSDFEKLLGIRTAPRQLVDPEGHHKMLQGVQDRRWRSKQRYEQRQQKLYDSGD